MWLVSDAQKDKRLSKLADRSVKKAKGSVKGTPTRKKSKPSKTVISPQSLKLQLGTTKRGTRKVYQASLDKILNLGKFSSKCLDNVSNVENKLIFPILGKFTLTEDVFLGTAQ